MADIYNQLSIEGKFFLNCYTIRRNLTKRPTTLEMAIETLRATYRAKDMCLLVWFVPSLDFCIDWTDRMAKSRTDFNLIDYRLSDSELEQFDKWLESAKLTPTECFSELAQRDYKCSFTFVENSEAWCVSITGKEDAKFNSKSTLTTWGDDPIEALYLAIFKAGVVFSWGIWKTKNQSRRG